jgi:hypothetical protein
MPNKTHHGLQEIEKVADMATRKGAAVHGAPDQSSIHVAAVKCQNSQVSGIGSRDKRDPFGPNGTT